ncbi:DUF4157 domain-containing protein [Streptomyces sp. Je 1-369]|uniref:eCIS core domain-containing protein n=1 Tax=Streptomyces sp. Je 1-369 TaxID=2966192 RepID=UPI0022865F83|nr:DUF4157 domain-containing protein [Streptomyces sp. Je 1-369]WAL95138.1 DUF4157 domain-containing protein [Streptomyces sp. Je 1-369]
MRARETARPAEGERAGRVPARGAASPSRAEGSMTAQEIHALQRSAGNAAVVRAVQRSSVHDVLRGGGRPLDAGTRTDMEARLGADFSDVRVHDDSAAKASAAEVGARAYTSGSHVVIGDGGADRHTLAHELTHVIQQRNGPVAGTDNGSGLKVSDPSDRFEREAEANAHRVLSGPAPEAHTEAAGHGHEHADHAETAVQRVPGTQTQTAPRVDWDRLLNIIVGQDRTLAGFQFGPECRNNGGNNLISRPVEVTVAAGGTTARLAVHLNVMLTSGGEVQNRKTGASTAAIRGSLFHLTARPLAGQNLIHEAGASSLTAMESIHVGRNNAGGWNNRPENTQILADAVDVPRETLLAALDSRYPHGGIEDLIERFKKDVGRAVIHGLAPEVVTVNWDGDDSFK